MKLSYAGCKFSSQPGQKYIAGQINNNGPPASNSQFPDEARSYYKEGNTKVFGK